MAHVQIGTKSVGSTVKLKVDGTARDFLVVHQGKPSGMYDASCDGTWLLMEDLYENREWHSSNTNDYENSTIHSYLNGTFLNKFDSDIKAEIKQIKVPYQKGTGSGGSVKSGAEGLSTKVFLLGGYEVGFTQAVSQYFPIDGARLAYFLDGDGSAARDKRIGKLSGSAAGWWLRSPYTYGTTSARFVDAGGGCDYNVASVAYGVRPALVLSSSLLVAEDGSVTTNTAPTTPASITIPEVVNGGSQIQISWAASTDAEGNLAGYKVERSINGGSTWTQIYQSTGTSCTDTITFGWETVQYRVKAYDSEGLESSWRTSPQRDVFNNTAPTTPPNITVPLTIIGGGNITVTWGASYDAEDNLEGYQLERRVDSGEWLKIYQGKSLSYEDTITKGWGTVTYRVRAYDEAEAYSAYATSPIRTVDNNTAPEITSDYNNNDDLGVKTEGFSLAYTVDDPDEDEVTVTEAVDGITKRTYTAILGQENALELTGEAWMTTLNGEHTITITATDEGGKSDTLTLTFEKAVYKLRIWNTEPMAADDLITKTVLTVVRSIPADATFAVLLTNNANDDEPAWEDATTAVCSGVNYLFTNEQVTNGHAYGFQIIAERGPSGEGGWIGSIGGAFE